MSITLDRDRIVKNEISRILQEVEKLSPGETREFPLNLPDAALAKDVLDGLKLNAVSAELSPPGTAFLAPAISVTAPK